MPQVQRKGAPSARISRVGARTVSDDQGVTVSARQLHENRVQHETVAWPAAHAG